MSVPNLLKYEGGELKWKTDLLKTEKYWPDWFKGLNRCFLMSLVPKVLLLAHPDRMDKELTIA